MNPTQTQRPDAAQGYYLHHNGAGVYYLMAQGCVVASFHGSFDGIDNASCARRDTVKREYIVRAVNSHAQLVAIAEYIVENAVLNNWDGSDLEKQARAALASANQ